MKEMINIAEILKNAPKGTKLYSSILGECKLIKIELNHLYSIKIEYISEYINTYDDFDKYGRYLESIGECTLFPSKDQRDWTKFKLDLPIDTPVMVGDGNNWILRYYAGNNNVWIYGDKSKDNRSTYKYNYIIPFDKFNPNDIEESLKHNIVKD